MIKAKYPNKKAYSMNKYTAVSKISLIFTFLIATDALFATPENTKADNFRGSFRRENMVNLSLYG